MSPNRATLAEVAARAGVSPSTASLAFSGAGPVAEATRQRVLEAARELGYSGPDPMARSLRRRRSGIVAVLIGERLLYAFRDPVMVGLLDGLAEELTSLDSGLLLLSGEAELGGPSANQVKQMPMDVAIFAACGLNDDPLVDHFLEREIPVVAVDGPLRDDVAFLGIDDFGGARALARHLAELGHEKVATLTLPLRPDGRRGPVDQARREAIGFADTERRLAGVEEVFGPIPAVEAAANLIEEAEEMAAHLLDTGERPTAILAQSDLLAVGAIRAAHARGLRVPEDLSVVGFDGIDTPWLGSQVLTTIEQPVVEKGRMAGRMVAELLAGRHPEDVKLAITTRIGATSAPPPPR
ncbi:LacI family DNA-binding transcriptional regulator [Actinobacteria bacterium YIM 96077]|uniref:LacI family transcriptional regulator n=1 Tax=Phytoactinopolyspora halophila TaxID=1981511 RepID=A0A329R0Z6_9ACTN|nr:LacI family DNA-binding transcriptional regulator [Phytoactinopolyspora halophila]AYY11474.1 LacI family DNA-binding transcriptional regulator [Actinobacteria bacterium YIM 96077]RAW18043.1 LacI family transcriptional regulator [Phytoactinopolyspora halophila]